MKRYINEEHIYDLFPPSGVQKLHVVQIDELPRADVVEVRHGYWKDNNNGTFTCSECGGKASKMNWCGCCGAKMDKERKEK